MTPLQLEIQADRFMEVLGLEAWHFKEIKAVMGVSSDVALEVMHHLEKQKKIEVERGGWGNLVLIATPATPTALQPASRL